MVVNKKILASAAVLVMTTTVISAQSGGIFAISQSVIASGGGQQTTSGVFSLDSTTAQSLAGENSTGGIFAVRGGFWLPAVAPTAARVSVGGRVRTAQGNGIRNVIVTLTDSSGIIRTAQTGTFGYFKFDSVTVGGVYLIGVSAKRYVFDSSTQIRTVQEEIGDLEFIAADL